MTPDEVPSDFVRNRLKHTPDEYLQNHAYMLDQSIAQVFSHNDPPEWIWHQIYALYYGLLADAGYQDNQAVERWTQKTIDEHFLLIQIL